MTRTDFLSELQEMLQLDSPLSEDTKLSGLEEWDSLAFMVLITYFDKKFSQKLTFDILAKCQTPSDLISLAGNAIA